MFHLNLYQDARDFSHTSKDQPKEVLPSQAGSASMGI